MRKQIVGIFTVMSFLVMGVTSGQYLYFTGNSDNSFQQGCSESYDVYYNAKGKSDTIVRGVASDIYINMSNSISYSTGVGESNLSKIFPLDSKWALASTSYPLFTNGISILHIGLNNKSTISGIGKIGSVKFTPKYSSTGYNVLFSFYKPGEADGSYISFNSQKYFDTSYNTVTGSIFVDRAPCINDTQAPVISNISYTSGSTRIISSGLSFKISDSDGNGTVPYVYTGGYLQNWTGNKWSINNQIGVNTGSISVNINGNGKNITLNGNKLKYTVTGPKTWQYLDRDYIVSTGSLFDFGIEEEIVITITGADRNGSKITNKITFNTPKNPVATMNYPANGQEGIPVTTQIKLKLEDEWAGINTGSITVVLSGINKEASGYKYIYSGFRANQFSGYKGSAGIGNSGSYYLTFDPNDFPYLGKFAVIVTVSDLKGNKINSKNIGSFTTSPSCAELQCCGDVDLYYSHGGVLERIGVVNTGNFNVSGGNNVKVYKEYVSGYNLGNKIYTGWLAFIDCGMIPNFSIFKGLPGLSTNVALATGVNLHSINLSGDTRTTKAVYSGGVITLSHYIDTLNLEFTSPHVNLGDEIYVTNNGSSGVYFEWEPKYGSDGKDIFPIASYYFELYVDPAYKHSNQEQSQTGSVSSGTELESFSGTELSVVNNSYVQLLEVTGDDFIITGSIRQNSGETFVLSKEFFTGLWINCTGDIPCTGITLSLPDGLYAYRVYAMDMGSNTGAQVEMDISGDVLDLDSLELTGSDIVAKNVYVANDLRPQIIIKRPENSGRYYEGSMSVQWDVENEEYGTGYFGPGISGYYYQIVRTGNIASGESIILYTGEVETKNISVNLSSGQYELSVYIIYKNSFFGSTTGGLAVTDFVVTKSNGGGGGGGRLKKDDCPNGDNSDSYYDGICDVDICGISKSNRTGEEKEAYLYAYLKGITTQCPIYMADLDGYLYRDQFAKMISVYAMKVVGKKPVYGKKGCDKFNDIYMDNKELQDYMKLSCELGLMGLESDGQTPKTHFDPKQIVTRAEFGTVISRLLFGDMYNIKDESKVYKEKGFWYKDHLQALKDYGVMTKVDGDWPQYKERRGWAMMMLERADVYGLFQGRSPAKNGIDALFTKLKTLVV